MKGYGQHVTYARGEQPTRIDQLLPQGRGRTTST